METVSQIARELCAAVRAADAAGFSFIECHVSENVNRRFNAATYVAAEKLDGLIQPERIIEEWEWTPAGYSPRYYVSIRPGRPDWEDVKNIAPDHLWY